MEYVDRFNQSFEPRDHAEALVIDSAFNYLINAGGPKKTAAEEAYKLAHTYLSPIAGNLAEAYPELKILGAEEFGFNTARGAFRWWNYSTQYVHYLDNHPNAEERPSQEELNDYGKHKNASGDHLLDKNPLYFHFYAMLERERNWCERDGAPISNPFEFENKAAHALLLRTLDSRVDGAEGEGFPRHRLASIDLEDSGQCITTIRTFQVNGSRAYSLSIFETDKNEEEPTEVFTFVEDDNMLTVGEILSEGKDPLSTAESLKIAQSLISEGSFEQIFQSTAKTLENWSLSEVLAD